MRLTIPLSDASSDALRRLASHEYRDPRMEAKMLLEQAIRDRAERTALTDDAPGALSTADTLTTGSREPEAVAL